jgi:SAM-dependent methyltransferase
MIGIDLSPQMIEEARRLNPELEFKVGDMRKLSLPDASFVGVIAFYSIVHLAPDELPAIMAELRRVLMPGGLILVAFHIGRDVVHVDELFGEPVNLDFRFYVPADVIDALRATGLVVIEQVEREPYPGAEFPSRRCYLLARAAS